MAFVADPRGALPTVAGPDWPAVRSFCTTRAGGAGSGPHASFNLGLKAGDEPAVVQENRRRLRLVLPGEPFWLDQVHGARVLDADVPAHDYDDRCADAAVTLRADRVLAVLSADCLPVVISDVDGRALGVAHAGWRGLAAGVLENTLAVLRQRLPAARGWQAWLAPAIGPAAFEVGDEVRAAFVAVDPAAAAAFFPGAAGKWWADLFALARLRLVAAGVDAIHVSNRCTVSEPEVFFSYRRDRGVTGRQAVLAWLDGKAQG